ncbi:insulinase family protein [Paroceanicella profunda]|uniref:Insulinase family protein n=1 Tax=Paroceanicella profunda TaxID=2579971 RepID=A0A5B8G2Q7_9RHOB|nr:pitrilysin family protein [Paroceanicella profunda]QDL93649.1 insulinase family protein [Paroceanicella profunda]
MVFHSLGRGLAAAAFLTLAALPLSAATDIEEVTSPGGIKAWLVQEHSIPIISLEISFAGGSALDPAGKEGAGNLSMALLEEGAGDRDAVAFARAAEGIGAQFGFSSGADSASVSASMLTENRDASVALLHDALTAPRFGEEAVERVRAQVLSGLRSDETDPQSIASKTFRELVFPDDPYGRSTDGTIESVTALTAADLRAAHDAMLVRSRARIGVVGDITPEELGKMLDTLFEGLPQDGPALPGHVEPNLTGGTTVQAFDTPQSVVVFAQKGIDRHDPDFFPAYVLNHILGGGGFSSRLTEEVREKRGLTYGVYSYLAGYDRANLWMGGVASANDRVGKAIEVIKAEWARMAQGGVTDRELQDAKTYLTGAYPLRFDSNSKIADILVGVQEEGLGIDYTTKRNDYVNAVTKEDIARVAKRLMTPDGLRFVVVGKPEGVTASN